jgi:hypothetical protein
LNLSSSSSLFSFSLCVCVCMCVCVMVSLLISLCLSLSTLCLPLSRRVSLSFSLSLSLLPSLSYPLFSCNVAFSVLYCHFVVLECMTNEKNSNSALNRERLGAIIFEDEEKRRVLNKCVHQYGRYHVCVLCVCVVCLYLCGCTLFSTSYLC